MVFAFYRDVPICITRYPAGLLGTHFVIFSWYYQVLTVVIYTVSATPDEPPPKTFGEFRAGVIDMRLFEQCIGDARCAAA